MFVRAHGCVRVWLLARLRVCVIVCCCIGVFVGVCVHVCGCVCNCFIICIVGCLFWMRACVLVGVCA